VLEELRTWYRARKTKSAVRRLLGLELEHNWNWLDGYWQSIAEADPETKESYVPGSKRVARLLEVPIPIWSHNVWQSQMALLPVVLDETETTSLYLLHTKLDVITALHQKVVDFEVQRTSVQPDPTGYGLDMYDPRLYLLSHNGPLLLAAIENIVAEMET
jgi:hypothetical protein